MERVEAEAGTGAASARCICFEGKTVKGIWQDFQLCLGYRGPSRLLLLFMLQFPLFTPSPCSTFCLPHSTHATFKFLAAFYHKVKVTFLKICSKGNSHWHALGSSLSLSPFLSFSSVPPSLSHTHVNTFSHRLVAFALFLLLLLFPFVFTAFLFRFFFLSLKLFTCAAVASDNWQPRP